MNQKVLKVHSLDNVIIALHDLEEGEIVPYEGISYVIQDKVSAKHKFAQCSLDIGDEVIMYGVLVGKATQPIPKGGLISINNIVHSSANFKVGRHMTEWIKPDVSAFKSRTFNGYHREDGKVGTMNYWLVIPLVFCENRNIKVIREAMSEQLGYMTERHFQVDTHKLISAYQNGADKETLLDTNIIRDKRSIESDRIFQNVDGIKFLTHDGGCGGTRQDSEVLCRLLAGYINHANVAGATVLSLGCQNAQIALLQEAIADISDDMQKPIIMLEQQKSTSEREFISSAVKQTFVGLIEANKIVRKEAPISKLCLGLECGGSDGFSGLTANPSLGYASDLLVSMGGSAVLAEFPELNGVEQELINRCSDKNTAEKFAQLMNAYATKAENDGSGFAFNPSPGNIKDGLITDAIKSAGAAKKGGTSPVTDVLDYTEQVTRPGLNLLCTPGNDVESTTGLAGSGANIIVFTTGLGTPTGNPVAPTIKVSTNSVLAARMPDIIDIDAGTIIGGEDSIESMGTKMLELIIKVASGEIVPKAVQLGQDDFIPWKRGTSL